MRDQRLVDLRNGRAPDALGEWLAAGDRETVVGLDFAFSFPRWYCERRRWDTARAVWTALAERGDEFIRGWPFWGPAGRECELAPAERYRRTERALGAKSVFQVAGAGAVGTGSVRGMPWLLELAERGFEVWPFDEPGWPRVVEIYPRALTGPVNKSRWADRHAYLQARFGDQAGDLLERAAGSQDAFDAAVSALVMGQHLDQLAALRPAREPWARIEGEIWLPP